MKKFKGNTSLIVVIVILAIVAITGIGAAIYFWQKSSKPAATASPTLTITSSPKTSPTKISPSPTSTPQTQGENAQQAAENFMKLTLGTLPGAQVDYEKAREYLSDTMKVQYSGDGWVPRFYGIQDGPDSVSFISENPTEDGVVLRYDAIWGQEVGLGWAFTMVKDNNKWYIDGFRNDAQ